MIKIFALIISVLLFTAALTEKSIEMAAGGMFFLALGVGGLLKPKFMLLFVGLALLAMLLLNLVTGEAFGLCRHCDNILLAQDPDAFWQQMLINSIFVFGLIFYGSYSAFYKNKFSISNSNDLLTEKEVKTETDALLEDLKRVAALLDLQSSKELKEKSASLFEELDEKYKDDNLAKPSIEDSKVFFAKEIQKREENEST